jgi:Undecaprenyl-phosphate glucose phosphotransferase
MLRTYHAFFSLFRLIIDIIVIAFLWIVVYYIRFYSPLSIPKSIPNFKIHLQLMLPVVCVCFLAFLWSKPYKSKRIQSIFEQIYSLLKVTLLSGLFLLSFFYYVKDEPYSRKLLALFIVMLFFGRFFSQILTMVVLRALRKKGYNLRHYAVIGAGRKGQQLVQDIKQMEWLGLKCAFFADDNPALIGTKLLGIPVLGPIEKVFESMGTGGVDEVYLTLGGTPAQKAYPVLESLQANGVSIRVVPDWGNLISLSNTSAITIGSQVLFSAEDSPLNGSNIIIKVVFDIVAALLLLLLLCVPFLIIVLLIKLSSKGPVFYKQVRVGMDQKEFTIIKFKTMKVETEGANNAKWTVPNDKRCTAIGKLLRRTSLDEIPQLLNIIKGQMSLVGPRPEQPFFVKQFSEEYRKYMIRHKVKAGMTGWAQIHGYRGSSSLRKRLIYDLYYVRNWSFWLDLWILLLTPWHLIKGENAY